MLVLAAERHDLAVEIQRGDVGGRVGREVHDQRRGLRHRVAHRLVQRPQHRLVRAGRDRADRGAGDDEAELVDRVGRVRHQDRVARAGDGGGQVGQPLLAAQRRHHLRLRVQPHVEPAGVVAGQRAAQAGDALAGAVAVGARVLHRLHQLGHDMRRGGAVRVAHPEVDDVLAGRPGPRLGVVHRGEHVGRQAADAVELGRTWRPRVGGVKAGGAALAGGLGVEVQVGGGTPAVGKRRGDRLRPPQGQVQRAGLRVRAGQHGLALPVTVTARPYAPGRSAAGSASPRAAASPNPA